MQNYQKRDAPKWLTRNRETKLFKLKEEDTIVDENLALKRHSCRLEHTKGGSALAVRR